jgi:hypothetical protein
LKNLRNEASGAKKLGGESRQKCANAAQPDVNQTITQPSITVYVVGMTRLKTFIREGKRRFALKRLDTILKGSSSNATAPEKHLDEIYITVLRHSISPDYTADEVEELCGTLKNLLGCIVNLFSYSLPNL